MKSKNKELPWSISIMEYGWMVVCTIETKDTKNKTADPNNPNPHTECIPKYFSTQGIHQQHGNERNDNIQP
jgi:hypothetical protein